jgi:hypothetical protein
MRTERSSEAAHGGRYCKPGLRRSFEWLGPGLRCLPLRGSLSEGLVRTRNGAALDLIGSEA